MHKVTTKNITQRSKNIHDPADVFFDHHKETLGNYHSDLKSIHDSPSYKYESFF